MAENQIGSGGPTQGAAPVAPPAPPVPMSYIPTPEEDAYLQECGKAITAGSDAATSAAAAGNGAEFSEFAAGVKALTDAYTAIKHGGSVSRHQGS